MKTYNDLVTLLKAADPVSREPGLSESEAARMRQTMLHVQQQSEPRRLVWLRLSAAGALTALILIAGTIVSLRTGPTQPSTIKQKAAQVSSTEAGERRQVQFATPGGTRIIWTLNPEFKVGGLAP